MALGARIGLAGAGTNPPGPPPYVPPDLAPQNAVPPSISGETTLGSVFTATPGIWTGRPTPTVAGQWERYTAGAWAEISGATATQYTSAHDGTHRYREIASNVLGDSDPVYSNEITVGTTQNPPVHIVAPIMSGNAYTDSTIHVLPGVTDGTDTITYTYQTQYRATSDDAWGDYATGSTFVPDTAGQYRCMVTPEGPGGVGVPTASNTMTVSQAPVATSEISKTFTGAGADTAITTFDSELSYFQNPGVTESLVVKAATNAVHAGNNSGSLQAVYPNTRSLGNRQKAQATIYQTDAGSQVAVYVRGVDYTNDILYVQAGVGGSTLVQKVGGVTNNYPLSEVFNNGDTVSLEISEDGTTATVLRNGAHTTGGTWPSPITLLAAQTAGGTAGWGLWGTTTAEVGSFSAGVVDDFSGAAAAPDLDYAPRFIGNATVGETMTMTYGVWFAAPEPTYAPLTEKWSGSAWGPAPGTNNTIDYTPAEAGDYRPTVTASNGVGSAVKAVGPSVTVTGGSVGTGDYVSARLLIDATNGAPEPAIARLEFLSGGTVLTGTASASSVAGAQYAASNAFDSDATTVWSSMLDIDDVPYLELVFPAPANFDAVAITAPNIESLDGSAAPLHGRVQVFDGTERVTVLTISNETGWSAGERRVFNR